MLAIAANPHRIKAAHRRRRRVASSVRLPGQYFDAETGLNYNYFRDYEPGTGRYVESDPIGLNGGKNTYAYVDSNPSGWIDESGRARGKYGDWIPAKHRPKSSNPQPFPQAVEPTPSPDLSWLSPVNLQILCADVSCCPRNTYYSCPFGNCFHKSYMGGYPSMNDVEHGTEDVPGYECHCKKWIFPDQVQDPSVPPGGLTPWDILDLVGAHQEAQKAARGGE